MREVKDARALAERLGRYFPPPPQTHVAVEVALIQQVVNMLHELADILEWKDDYIYDLETS